MRTSMRMVALCGLAAMVAPCAVGSAAITFGVDPAAPWTGFMNVFELPANGGGYAFGSGWGTADLNASFSGSVLTLTPNTSISRDVALTDTFWWTPAGQGNKIMDANFYQERNDIAGELVTFEGRVLSNSLTAAYPATAFIKDFAPDYSSNVAVTVPLTPGNFSISLQTVAGGHHIQFGFEMIGANARLDQVAGFGMATVTAVPEPGAGLAAAGAAGILVRRRRA